MKGIRIDLVEEEKEKLLFLGDIMSRSMGSYRWDGWSGILFFGVLRIFLLVLLVVEINGSGFVVIFVFLDILKDILINVFFVVFLAL